MSIGGSRYVITFIDDYTRHTWVCLTAKKSEVFACFLKVKSLAERETGRKIKWLRSEDGKEYLSNEFESRVIYRRREFKANFLVDTHQNRMM